MSDARKAFKQIIEKLKKLLSHLDNANAHERDVAITKINKLLQSVNLKWVDLITLMEESGNNKSALGDLFRRILEKEPDCLVRIAREKASFFYSPVTGKPAFADIAEDGCRRTLPLSSSDFIDWLMYQFYIYNESKVAPKAASVKQAIRTLSAIARYEGEAHEVNLRIAAVENTLYLDLADPAWHVVEITAAGWRLLSDAPVRFRRPAHMTALPLPQRGGSINQLRRFVNLSDDNFILYITALADALRPRIPHPIVYFAAETGAGKTSASRVMCSLIDPIPVDARALPNTVREVFVNINDASLVVFDNVSKISPAISDALCQIASGGGIVLRKLFTDTDQISIGGSRSVILTGITNAVVRSDLADRAVILPMAPIKPTARITETKFWADFESERAAIFGALLDVVVHGLKRLPRVRLSHLPRMADFAKWGVACETAYTVPGAFLRAYEARAAEAVDNVVENDPIAVAIIAFMQDRVAWSGTSTELHIELGEHDRAEAQPSAWRTWPKDTPTFGKALAQIKSALRKVGIEVTVDRAPDRKRTRRIELRHIEVTGAAEQQTEADGTDSTDSTDSADGTTGGAMSKKTGAVVPLKAKR